MRFGGLSENAYLLRLEKGEEVLEALSSFCSKHNVLNGVIVALGSVENPILSHYRVDAKKYSEKKLKGIFEVTNLTGTIGLIENKPLVHVHVVLSDENMRSFGGHLVKTLVSATLEVVIWSYPSSFEKKYDDEIGLKLFELPEEM